jgi:2-aminoethylphosphonate-pyruvate transaminase
MDDENPYLLLTPGPLTTSPTVRRAMLRDSCTWEAEYNTLVNTIRRRLVALATGRDGYTTVLMQGSGTFAVEATLGSVVPAAGKVLIVNNGAYGRRMVEIADRLHIARTEVSFPETAPADPDHIARLLADDPALTHVALVHCETTSGLLNPVAEVGRLAAAHGKIYIVDAMSSFGGISLTMEELGAHYLISSANKCIQGVPGFGFVIADRALLARTRSWARSLSLDLYDQWREMEEKGGKWRYTSPTHVVRAFAQALNELDAEGGVAARHRRYCANHECLLAGMQAVGFRTLLPRVIQSPIITAFLYPDTTAFSFEVFYQALKSRGFVIYPGKVSQAATFRIGTIGHVFPEDIARLNGQVSEVASEMGLCG